MSEYLTKDFKVSELACPCCRKCEMDPVFLTRLQALRDVMNCPLVPVSGYRCQSHNDSLPGSGKQSQHLYGRAADIRVRDFDAATRHRLIKTVFSLGFTGIGIGKIELHLDTRPGSAKSWGY